MKKLLIFALTLGLFACTNDDEPKSFQIKATDMISIKPDADAFQSQAMKIKADDAHLSALEIVKQADGIYTPFFERSFIDDQRDTISIPPRLLMWATDVIMLNGELQTEWIEATDVVFIRYTLPNWQGTDTIAYIPNSVLRTAETAIRAAYEAKDMDECYRLFNDAYTFTPITGEEWRALKSTDQN